MTSHGSRRLPSRSLLPACIAPLPSGLLLITLGLLLPSPTAGQALAAGEGRLVIMGGGGFGDQPDVYRAILEGRRSEGPTCVIPTASASPQRSMESAVSRFVEHGGQGAARGIPSLTVDTPAAARNPAVVETMRGCSGFYFVGGVQSRIVTVLRPGGNPTPAYEALMARFRAGAVVAGSSAGAAVMSDPMIAGGASGSMASGVRRAGDERDERAEDENGLSRVSIEPGLGFFSGLVDQHHLARGRFSRLLVSVLELEEYDLGFGIDESTALVVDGDAAWPVGASGIVVVDESTASRQGSATTGVTVHLMSQGDRFDLGTRRLESDASKTALPEGPEVAAPEDLFERWVFFQLVDGLARSTQAEVAVAVEGGGRIMLRKGPDFAAVGRTGEGPVGTTAGLSVRGLVLDLHPGT